MIEIFSSPKCGYCDAAKALLKGKGLVYRERDIASDPEERAELLRRLPRAKAVPQIFIDGRHIGGFEDLELLDARGELDTLAGS